MRTAIHALFVTSALLFLPTAKAQERTNVHEQADPATVPPDREFAFRFTGSPHPSGGTYLTVALGSFVHRGVSIVSSPSDTVLAILITADFERSDEGKAWMGRVLPMEVVNNTTVPVASLSRFDGKTVQVYVPARPATDNVLEFRFLDLPRPTEHPDQRSTFRIASIGPSIRENIAVFLGPLDFTQICCHAEGDPCRNCQTCKYDILACCPDSGGNQSCGGSGWAAII